MTEAPVGAGPAALAARRNLDQPAPDVLAVQLYRPDRRMTHAGHYRYMERYASTARTHHRRIGAGQ